MLLNQVGKRKWKAPELVFDPPPGFCSIPEVFCTGKLAVYIPLQQE